MHTFSTEIQDCEVCQVLTQLRNGHWSQWEDGEKNLHPAKNKKYDATLLKVPGPKNAKLPPELSVLH